MDLNNNLSTERFSVDFKQAVGGNADKLCRRSGLSHDDVRRLLRGELPSREEFAKIRRFYPQLKKYAFLFNDRRRIVTARVPAAEERAPVKETRVEAKAPREPVPQIVLRVEPPKKAPATSVEVSDIPMSRPAPPSPLTVKNKGSSPDQYTRVEAIDPPLAEILLKGNVMNRPVSMPLVDALVRDILSGAWTLSHQGIAVDKDGRLLDGQHRLLAVVKSNKTVEMPVTYNVLPEAFNVIDLGGRPRSISDIEKLTRGLRYGRTVIAACKTIAELSSPTVLQRWTKSEIDALLDLYQHDCEWAAGKISKAMGSAAVVAGLAYAYPTDKDRIGEFAERLATRVGMTSPLAALWNAYERQGRAATASGRVDLAHMTMRCVWAYQKGEDLKKVYIRVAGIGGEGGKNANTAFRHFRHLRLKMELHE